MSEPQTHQNVPDGWSVVSAGAPMAAPSAPSTVKKGPWWNPVEIPSTDGADLSQRPDQNMLKVGSVGIPPEAALGVTAAGRAISGASGMAGKVAAAVAQATPVLKYELTKAALHAMHVPSAIAIPVAMAVSGYKKGAAATSEATAVAAPEALAAERAAPVASPSGAPAPPAGPSVQRSGTPHPEGGIWSPQRIQNELGILAKRQGVTLNQDELTAAARLVEQGQAPADVVASVKQLQAEAPAAPALPKARLNAAEAGEYMRLMKAGKSHADAMASIAEQRTLQKALGTPATRTVLAKVKDRNATGRWSE